MDSSYDSGSSSDSPLSPRTRKRRSSTNDENDASVKYVRCGVDHVSNWDNSLLESYGILYDVKATELSELYKSAFKDLYSLAVKRLEEHAVLWTKLLKIKKILVESTKKCLHSLDVDEEFSKMNMIKCMALEKETEKCLDAMTKIKEEIALTMRSEDIISGHIFSLWHAGIVEYVQYYSQLIKDLSFDRRLGVEGEFCQHLAYFTRIFLLSPIRGDATGKMQLNLYGVETSSGPDLRFSMQRKCSAEERGVSVTTATVGEIIFTCLDMDTEHLSSLLEGSPVHNEKSYIHYSKPYNILVRKDREEILETLFHLGL